MPSQRTVWVVVVIALAQALLGGLLAVNMSTTTDPVETQSPRSSTSLPSAPGGAPSPGSALPGQAPTPGGVPPTGDLAGPAAPPASDPGGERPTPIQIFSKYDKLTPEEGRYVEAGPPFEPVVEGRLVDGSVWRLSAYERPTGEICSERNQWNPERGSGGGGGGDCRNKKEWDFGGGGSGDRYMAVNGFAPLNAATFRIVAKNATEASVPGAFHSKMAVTFFLGYIGCDGPDVARLEALDANGRVLGTYEVPDIGGFGFPSQICEMSSG